MNGYPLHHTYTKIPTIPQIPMIIQISLKLWFRKGMTLDVYHDIPEIINIPDISDIPNTPTIPAIPNIIQISSMLWFRKGMTLDVGHHIP